ncbi:hypothetical protein O3U67_15805 [Brevundimonas diminuta]|uniref:hypothetical protein n=1 Tax=Brevundimonas diminuta TaxID=293 RepID=UPI0022AE9C42|nr:hypothetical protein [Brevundimonas diminuta]MCZ4109555.1 hypothetical protein [Brevundimonas diminuta]
MECSAGFHTLLGCQFGPHGFARISSRHPASASSHRVKDRSVERRINNLMVGHFRPRLSEHHANFADQLRKVAFDRMLVLNGKAA